jgi:hypothetical protein
VPSAWFLERWSGSGWGWFILDDLAHTAITCLASG